MATFFSKIERSTTKFLSVAPQRAIKLVGAGDQWRSVASQDQIYMEIRYLKKSVSRNGR